MVAGAAAEGERLAGPGADWRLLSAKERLADIDVGSGDKTELLISFLSINGKIGEARVRKECSISGPAFS